ncbi:amino acid adenylation domain-containing protein [Streptomyces sp. NPDC003077]|uniref:amino acid adenylation domain-containing protein n=1 Tax=Streptomyces sp. NPDC003077 TaxID=3154443 RepID=UPI0033BC2BAE
MPATTAWRQQLVRDFADAWAPCGGGAPVTGVRRIMARHGWFGLCVPAERGGLGLGWYEAALLAEELGRALLPGDALDGVAAAPWVAVGAPDALGAVLRGEVAVGLWWPGPVPGAAWFTDGLPDLVVVPGADDGGGSPAGPSGRPCDAAPSGARIVRTAGMRTEERCVPGGTVVELRLPEDEVASRVSEGGVASRPLEDGLASRVREDGAASRLLESGLSAEGAPGPSAAMPWAGAALLRAAHLVGLGRTALRAAADRAGRRRQFGKLIGAYQAVAFPLATQRARLEGLRLSIGALALMLDGLVTGERSAPGLGDEAGAGEQPAWGRRYEAEAGGQPIGYPGTAPAPAPRDGTDPLYGTGALLDAVRPVAEECAAHALHVSGAAGLADETTAARCYLRLLAEQTRDGTGATARPGHVQNPGHAQHPDRDPDLGHLPRVAEPRALWDAVPEAALVPLLRRRVPSSLNDTAARYPDGPCLHRFVERAAARHPERPAVRDGSTVLTYRELDERADRLAHVLRGRGTGPDDAVGICMERSADAVAAILAVLKAGGACLLLDPADPPERLAFLLRDSGAVTVLTHDWLTDWLPEGAPVLAVDRLGPLLDRQPAGLVPPRAQPRDLAYLVYTSGSTGMPKGVEVEHRNLANRLHWDARMFPLGPGDAVLQHTALGFDASIWEVFAPLMSGATLVLAAPRAAADPRGLLETMLTNRVTAFTCVPSVLDLLLEEKDPGLGAVTGLRHVFCGGEVLPPGLVRRFHASGTRAVLHNLYGPSECAIDVTHWRCGPQDADGPVPIGRPLANVRVYVLDESGAPVPAGRPGELYVAGAGVTRGYRHRPALTQERFVPDPFTEEPGGRLYRTGDMVRLRPDGSLDFLGRADDQVKIHGHRIELGEIRNALELHPQVRTAVLRADADRIDAYVVAALPYVPDTRTLRRHLRERLPEYMVPAGIGLIPFVPLTANGKVDHGALPALSANGGPDRPVSGDAGHHDGADDSAAPGDLSPTERALASLAARVLGLERLGVAEDFFAAGGSSLHAARYVTQVRNELGLGADLETFLAAPTVKDLAAALANGGPPERRPRA